LKPFPPGLFAPLPPPPRPPLPDEVFLVLLVKVRMVMWPAVVLLLLMLDPLQVVWCPPSFGSIVGHYVYLIYRNPCHGSQSFLLFAPHWSGRHRFVNSVFRQTLLPLVNPNSAAAWSMSSLRSLLPCVAFLALLFASLSSAITMVSCILSHCNSSISSSTSFLHQSCSENRALVNDTSVE
jgi:hypothetical protein